MESIEIKSEELRKVRVRIAHTENEDVAKILEQRQHRLVKEIRKIKKGNSVKKEYTLTDIQDMIKYGWNQKIKRDGWMLLANYEGEV